MEMYFIISFLIFCITQLFAWRLALFINKNRTNHSIHFFLTFLFGTVMGALLMYSMTCIPNGEWKQVLSPDINGVEITYATRDVYCLVDVEGIEYCCGYVVTNEQKTCLQTTSLDIEKGSFSGTDEILDNKNHLFYSPKKPEKSLDIYFVYSYFFEGNEQIGYCLSVNGNVWEWRQYVGSGYDLIAMIIVAILGGAIGLFHTFIRIIISTVKKQQDYVEC